MSVQLDHYRLLGRSGLRVSPLSLGTMTFGVAADWGCEELAAEHMFNHYVERGGNFIDTANFYAGGESERIVGRLIQSRRESAGRTADSLQPGRTHRRARVDSHGA